jgi:predicted permease
MSRLSRVIRRLLKAPLFTCVAVLTLALGIGANTAIFSVIRGVLLKPLPFDDPDRLVGVWHSAPGLGLPLLNQAPGFYLTYREEGRFFEDSGMWDTTAVAVTGTGEPERISGLVVTDGVLNLLHVQPVLGRRFTAEDDSPKAPPRVMLANAYWQRKFGSDPSVVGRQVTLDGKPYEIVGVLPAGFRFLDTNPQIVMPFALDRAKVFVGNFSYQGIARLKPGATLEQANADVARMIPMVAQRFPMPPGFTKQMFEEVKMGPNVRPLAQDVIGDVGKVLWLLLGTVGMVLLIACANVANLLIARAFMRQREIAVRLSLGASRGRLVQQLLVESLVLSFAGAVVGIFLSAALTRGLLSLIPTESSPLLISPRPDVRILAFTLVLTTMTGIIFGLVPALRASRVDLWTTLKATVGSIAGTTGSSLFLRKGLVTAQVALSFLLLFGAGLFVRSLQNLKTTETGVALDNLVSFQLSPALSDYDAPRTVALYQQLQQRIQSSPGVKSVGYAVVPILAGDEWDSSTSVEGHKPADGEDMQAFMNALSPGYFEAMKIPILEGRDFRVSDLTENSKVAIVNRRFAEHFFKGQSALGKHLGRGTGPKTKLDVEIIGVVADSLYEGPREGVRRQVFVPNWGKSSAVFYVRTQSASASAYSLIRNEMRQLDSAMPIYSLKTLESQLDETLLTDRLIALLSAGFGLLATILASVGLYGVMAFVVARRRKELGIRLALGAQPRLVIWLVMREVLVLLAIGLAVGLPAALGLGRYVSSQLYGIDAHDPGVAIATIVVLSLVSAAAGLIPAHRASKIDPILAIRYE